MSDRPYKVASAPVGAREGDVPYWAKWSDGSEYWVGVGTNGVGVRFYHGPMFGRALGDLHVERTPESSSVASHKVVSHVAVTMKRLVCFRRGHERFPDPPSYWHSHERCVRCLMLTDSPMVAPNRWTRRDRGADGDR